MANPNLIHLTTNAATAVDDVIGRLVSTDMLNGRYRISMPVATCTGSLIDVMVWPEPGDTFMVSDDGTAHFEIASGAYSDRIFSRVAKDSCASYGAVFDDGTMLLMRVTAPQLRGAIIAMTSLIKEVVDETVSRSIRAKAESAVGRLYERLDRAFDPSKVVHDAEVIGASTAGYTVDALVRTDAGDVVFDLFTMDPNSISAAFTKFSDIHRLAGGPRLVGVTRDPVAVGPKLQLIASVAPVIRLDAAPESFKKLAA